MAKPRVLVRDNKLVIEDGNGGVRPLTDMEMLNVRLDIPTDMKQQWTDMITATRERAAAGAAYRESRDIRMGKVRPGTDPRVPLNEMGVSGWERFTVKNLIDSPEYAKAYLVLHKYEVESYGDGFNFAVRKGPGQPWRMVDPRGGFDTAWDILDLTGDALSSAAIIAGTATAGPAGGVMAGMGVEAARQTTATMAGVPQPPNPNRMLWAGAAGLALPAGGAFARGPLAAGERKIEQGAVKLSAKIIGSDPETVLARAGIKGFGKLSSTVEAARAIRRQLASFTDDLTPARQEAQAIIDELGKRGATVDLSPFTDGMRKMTLGPKGQVSSVESGLAGMGEPSIHTLALKLFQRTKATLASGGYDETAVPIALAEKMKRKIQMAAARAKAYEDVELGKESRAWLRDISHVARRQIETVADVSGVVGPSKGLKYSSNMAELDKTMKIVGAMEESFNAGTTETRRAKSAQAAVRALHGDSGTEYMDHLRNFDKLVGTNLSKQAYEASVGKAFGQAGEIGIIPRFTPMGNVLMVGGGGASLATANPTAAVASLAAASPYVNMAALKIGSMVKGLTQKAAPAVTSLPSRMTAQMALEELLNRSGVGTGK